MLRFEVTASNATGTTEMSDDPSPLQHLSPILPCIKYDRSRTIFLMTPNARNSKIKISNAK